MTFRKLRIAWSVFWGVACVLMVVLWVRSYWLKEQVEPSFGHSQVEQFIRDRPGVSEVINREPALRAMLEASFEGAPETGRVHWDKREPTASTAQHLHSRYGLPTLVRVTKRSDTSAVDKCAKLLFELYNVQSDGYFNALRPMVASDQISREDYARSVARGEFTAAKKTRDFFRTHPLTDGNSDDNSWYKWLLEVPEELSAYLRSIDDDTDYLERIRHEYDKIKSDYAP
jgi:hypothetical protein